MDVGFGRGVDCNRGRREHVYCVQDVSDDRREDRSHEVQEIGARFTETGLGKLGMRRSLAHFASRVDAGSLNIC
jgi:hypothetical protein